MKKAMKSKLSYIIFTVVIMTVLLMTLSSCDLFGGSKQTAVAPKLDVDSLPRMERINPDYFNQVTKQNEIYHDEEAIMPVRSGEKVYIVIDYKNQSNLKINKVVITGGGEEKEILSKDFFTDSDSNRTKIEFEINEVETPRDVTYTISKIFYNLGAQVISMTLNPDYTQLRVSVDPELTLKFDHDNADVRTGKSKSTSEVKVLYASSLSTIIPTVTNQSGEEGVPVKEGGWSFRGYFTQTNGQGIEVKPIENYYFWKDITLYAHYERLYTFSVANAPTPIPYLEGGITKYYNKVATVIKKTTAGDLQSDLEIYDTIADDNGIYPIVAIGSDAFDKTNSLRNLKIGKYVKYIGPDAFSSSKVMNVEFHPQGVLEKIDNRAFFGTSNLGTGLLGFTLPRTVTYLGDRCFESSGWGKMVADGDTTASTKLVIYDNITHIGNWCFTNTRFTEVIFRPGVKFKADAVSGVNYVEEIDGFPTTANSDYYLGWALFKGCEQLKVFRTLADPGFANGLEFISAAMFDIRIHSQKSNVGLTNVVFSEGLKKIDRGAFHYQKLLTNLVFPDTLEDIGSENEVNGSNANFAGTNNEKSEYGSFAECILITNIVFGEGSQLKALGCKAFYNNRALRSIHITSKVFEYYGDGPFQGCELLTEVYFDFDDADNIPEPIRYPKAALRKDADFFYPVQPFKVFVPDNVVSGFRLSFNIGASDVTKRSLAVYSQALIHYITVDDKIIKIALEETQSVLDGKLGWKMGYYFGSDTVLTIPESYNGKDIVEIGSYAFNTVVEKITLPTYVARIAAYAFSNCENLTEIVYGNILAGGIQEGVDSLKEIGEKAFYKTGIRSFVGGQNLERIGSEAFMASKLEWVDLKRSNIGGSELGVGAFYKCSNLKYVRLPHAYQYMSNSLFADCTALRFIVFENASPGSNFFSNPGGAYFQGVPSGVVTAYVPTLDSVQVYNELINLPNALRSRFQYNSAKPSPSPEDLLTM